MDKDLAKKYYLRPEIQKAILNFAKDREIAVFFTNYFKKRPDILEHLSDVKAFAEMGLTSFHGSEERWTNALLLSPTISEEEKENNRCGWDLILDLDGVDFEYAKIFGKIIVDYLTEIGIKNLSVKFSGNKGFHIGIPFEAMPKYLGIQETRKLFPDLPRKISGFLIKELENKIIAEILKRDKSIENIAQKYNIDISDLIISENGIEKLNYLRLIEIDTILISSRHLFRSPYSFNEKSGLVSIPINKFRIMEFQKDEAKPENVDPKKYEDFEFLKYDSSYNQDARILFEKTEDFSMVEGIDIDQLARNIKMVKKEIDFAKTSQFKKTNLKLSFAIPEGEIFEINEEVNYVDFPETIKYLLENKIVDGKKRALFVLLTYLYSINYSTENINSIVEEWNLKQDDPLKPNYIQAQKVWFKNQKNKISTPNYNNDNYYKSIGVPVEIIQSDISKFGKFKIKNPLHHTFTLIQQKNAKKENKQKESKKKDKKEELHKEIEK